MSAAVPLALLPILTRHLDPASYGLIGISFSIVGVFSAIIGLNLHGLLTSRHIANPAGTGALIGTILILTGLTTLAALAVSAALSPWLPRWTGLAVAWLPALLGIASGQFVINLLLALYQAEDRPVAYGALQVSLAVLGGGLSLALIVGWDSGWGGRVVGTLIATIACAVLTLSVLLQRHTILRWDAKRISDCVRYGFPLVPYVLSSWLLIAIERPLLGELAGLASVGLYFAAVQLAQGLNMVHDAVNKAWCPWVYGHLAAPSGTPLRTVAHMARRIAAAYVLLAVLCVLGAPYAIGFLLGDAFAEASLPFAILACASTVNGCYKLVITPVFFHERTDILAGLTIASAVLTLAVDLLTVPCFGAAGAALGMVAGNLLILILGYLAAQRLRPISFLSRGGA